MNYLIKQVNSNVPKFKHFKVMQCDVTHPRLAEAKVYSISICAVYESHRYIPVINNLTMQFLFSFNKSANTAFSPWFNTALFSSDLFRVA